MERGLITALPYISNNEENISVKLLRIIKSCQIFCVGPWTKNEMLT